LGIDSQDKQPEQDSQDKTAIEGGGDITARIGNRGQRQPNIAARTGQRGWDNRYDIWDRITQTGQPGQVSLGRSA
jgi:hypothetical protein